MNRLPGEIVTLQSHESAATWAREALPTKNQLIANDAKLLEGAFEQRLAALPLAEDATPVGSGEALSIPASASQETEPTKRPDQHQPAGLDQHTRIDKSVLTISAPRRYRSKEHLTALPVLRRKPSDAHHLRFMQPRALGRKTSDEFAVPLCRTHHRAAHRAAD